MLKSHSNIRIHLHDFAGHPFQAELSNEFSNSGFQVLHSFFAHSGAQKALLADIHNSGNIHFQAVTLNQSMKLRT